jgi:hypothetical protein
MPPTNPEPPESETPEPPPTDGKTLSDVEQDLLARVRDVAQEINQRVKKALGDDQPEHPPPGPNESPPVA